MKDNIEEEVLLKFQKGQIKAPILENENEKKIFLQLQKYSLIYMTPEGVWVVSQKGKNALKYGVQKFLTLERFEERIVKKSMSRETERKWIFFAVIPLIVVLAGVLCIKIIAI
ncbi:hypothetical protein NE848_08240 [Gramella jeungdoensis]|uniref:Uncharacterized protein n=1 Tax=Gramella jeungdoensis TaxID=708091 RepID=A0ABT0Z1W5_9FLAO|nr:hypothetical protein [Gramella jeungdoensis]MCM8569365.1 hypothetical protein [Gramella jeungdoensis]